MSEEKTKMLATAEAFVAVLGDRMISNAVGATEDAVLTSLELLDLKNEDLSTLEVVPCKITLKV